jgi:hypothetical protein
MFYVRLRTMVKNRIVTAFDRYPEQTAAEAVQRSVRGSREEAVRRAPAFEIDRIQTDRGLAFIDDIGRGSSNARRRSRHSPKATPTSSSRRPFRVSVNSSPG